MQQWNENDAVSGLITVTMDTKSGRVVRTGVRKYKPPVIIRADFRSREDNIIN